MAQLHFLDFAVISVTTRKIHLYVRKKSLLGKVIINFFHQIVVNNLSA